MRFSEEKTFKYWDHHFWCYIYLSCCNCINVSDRKTYFCL